MQFKGSAELTGPVVQRGVSLTFRRTVRPGAAWARRVHLWLRSLDVAGSVQRGRRRGRPVAIHNYRMATALDLTSRGHASTVIMLPRPGPATASRGYASNGDRGRWPRCENAPGNGCLCLMTCCVVRRGIAGCGTPVLPRCWCSPSSPRCGSARRVVHRSRTAHQAVRCRGRSRPGQSPGISGRVLAPDSR
jgi:hypothetical protein